MFPPTGQSYKFGEKIGSYIFEDDPGLSPQSGSCQDSSKTEQHKTAYRCRKCRRIIAVEDNVISHVPGEGDLALTGTEGRVVVHTTTQNKIARLYLLSL